MLFEREKITKLFVMLWSSIRCRCVIKQVLKVMLKNHQIIRETIKG